jgi:type IV pilus assembly protein PilY1
VFYMRTPGQQPTDDPLSAASYRTVLVMGLRGGGNHYFALDVTDPLNPRFLWQFTDRYMGQTFARPAIGQVLVEIGGVLQERAIALLPGGRGDIDLESARTTGPVGCPSQGIGAPPVTRGTTNARSRQRCWGRVGRDLHWVDVVTGETIFSFDGSVFNAPVTGGVSLFTGDTGTIATRAFVTDEDGVIWRIDFSSRRPSDWTARPFHDIFWDGDATTGQPAYEPPVLTTDVNGNVVILQATGNIDQLDGTALNRVVSLRECMPGLSGIGTDCPTGTTDVTASLNWEIRLRPGEQVTGPLDLYQSVAYFGTFESTSGADACAYGQSRIWGVGYLEGGGVAPTGYTSVVPDGFPTQQIQTTEGGAIDAHFLGPFENQIVMGVQVTQQITCVTGDDDPDPYLGMRYDVTGTGASQFQLTAQVSGRDAPGTPGTSSVRTITRTLPAPPAYTRVLSWVPQADQ